MREWVSGVRGVSGLGVVSGVSEWGDRSGRVVAWSGRVSEKCGWCVCVCRVEWVE